MKRYEWLCIFSLLSFGCQGPSPAPPAAGGPGEKQATQAEPQPARPAIPSDTVRGVFLGRSGKPMARARVLLGEVHGDEAFRYARIRLVAKVPTAVTDAEGRFEFKGVAPGEYTIVYQPAGTGGLLPVEIGIRTLSGTTASIAPLLRGFELGTDKPFAERPWGSYFTLLKGHTLYSEGPTMKIWNATARQNQGGAHLEIRRGVLWTHVFEPGAEIRFEAWSF